MDFKDKFCMNSEKDKEKNKDKIPLTDFEYLFLEALNKIADNLAK